MSEQRCIVTVDLLNKIGGYLATRPWQEVNALLAEMLRIVPMEEEEKKKGTRAKAQAPAPAPIKS